MIKVLNIPTNGIRREGINSMQLRWTRMIDKSDLQMDVAAVHNNAQDVIDEYKSLGCRVFELPDRQRNPFQYVVALYLLMKKEKYNAVHVHGSSGLIGIELLVAKITGTLVRIAHSRNTMCDHSKGDILFRPIMNFCMTHALACSKAAGEWLFSNKKFEVIHNGIDASAYKFDDETRNRIRAEFKLGSSLVVGFVGNIKKQKNPFFLIEIFADLHKKIPNTILMVVGDGVLKEAIERRTDELGIRDYVKFIGRSDRVPDLMKAMDCLLFPSLYEGFGNVVLEAQISGLPVLVSNQVPEDCQLSSLVSFLPIDQGTSIWSEKILKIEIPSNQSRKDSYDHICVRMKEEHFDLNENVKRFRELYVGQEEK